MEPTDGVMVRKLLVPSLETPALAVQLVVVKSGFCRKIQPVEGYGQEIFRLWPERAMVTWGAEGCGADWLGSASRPRKRMLPDWVSRMQKRNG